MYGDICYAMICTMIDAYDRVSVCTCHREHMPLNYKSRNFSLTTCLQYVHLLQHHMSQVIIYDENVTHVCVCIMYMTNAE